MDRAESLQDFLDTASVAFDRFADDIRSRNSMTQIFASLEAPFLAFWALRPTHPPH